MKRVWIFGDSFADPNWEKERYVHETWYEKLEKQYDEYHNFAFAGTGPHYSFKEFYQRYESFNEDDTIGTIEAVKTAADIFCPLPGEIVEVNLSIEDSPELVNNSPYDKGWLVKMKVKEGVSDSHLLSPSDYEKIIL